MRRLGRSLTLALAAWLVGAATIPATADEVRGGIGRPLRVLILPVDGGTADGTLADYQPSFDAVTRFSGLHFDVKVGQTYAAVVEAIGVGVIDIAQFAVGSYADAARRGAIEPLAIQVIEGAAVYYGGLFVPATSGMQTLAEARGQSIALADVNSTSSFIYPAAMLLTAGVDLRTDMRRVVLTGSHSAALQALAEGRVEIAAASLVSYERALNAGIVRPGQLRIVARSAAIPNPFLAMRADLPAATKAALRQAFAGVGAAAQRARVRLRGYGGRTLDRWETDCAGVFAPETLAVLHRIDGPFKAAVAARAARN